MFALTEYQTEMDWLAVENEVSKLENKLKDRPEIRVETIVKGNDKNVLLHMCPLVMSPFSSDFLQMQSD